MGDLISAKIDEAIVRLKAVGSKAASKDVCFEYTERMYDEITRVKSEKWSWASIEQFICAGDEELLNLFNVDRLRVLYKRVSVARDNAKRTVKAPVRKAKDTRKVRDKNTNISRDISEPSGVVLRDVPEVTDVVSRETSVVSGGPKKQRMTTVVED